MQGIERWNDILRSILPFLLFPLIISIPIISLPKQPTLTWLLITCDRTKFMCKHKLSISTNYLMPTVWIATGVDKMNNSDKSRERHELYTMLASSNKPSLLRYISTCNWYSIWVSCLLFLVYDKMCRFFSYYMPTVSNRFFIVEFHIWKHLKFISASPFIWTTGQPLKLTW